MVATAPTRERPRGIVLRGVPLFAAGKHRDDAPTYTRADLEDMVRNFYRFRDRLHPPLVLGHEEEQPLARRIPGLGQSAEENTGNPALGWLVALRLDGDELEGDFAHVHPWAAAAIKQKLYRFGSAEVYDRDSPPPGVPAEGCVLRRVAMLGATPPQVKTLGPWPDPEWGWAPPRRYAEETLPGGTYQTFVEAVKPMDRAELEGQLTALGYSDEQMAALKDLPDDAFGAFVLATLAREAGTAGAGTPPPPPEGEGGGGPPPAAMAEFPEGMDRQALIDWLTAQGKDPAALEAMTDDDLIDMYNQRQAGPEQMSEPGVPDEDEEEWEELPVPATPTPAPPAPPARRPVKSVTKTIKFSEEVRAAVRQEVRTLVAAETAAFRKEAGAVKAAERARQAEEKRGRVRAFCERMLKENRVSPAELDESTPALPSLVERLMLCNAETTVRKFSEGGKEVALTQLDVEMRAIEARQPRKYNEKLPGGKGEAVPAERKQQLLAMTSLGRQILAARANGKN